MDKIKTWIIEVALKNVAPKVSNAVIAAGITFFMAHQELMQQMGITFYADFVGKWVGPMPTGRVLVVEIDTLGIWGALAVVGGATALWGFFQHHTVATVTGAPQSGDKRANPEQPVIDGQRADDPKGETK